VTHLDDTAAALRSATARLSRRLRAEAGQSEYTGSQIAVIRRLLESGPATTSELARAEGMRPQSMSATIAALEAADIVGRRPDPDDGRATQVFVTAEAERSILDGRTAKQEWLARTMAERLTPVEQRTLADAVALLDRLLEP
jgi:DNA-binding MarR family transcriptional regulator